MKVLVFVVFLVFFQEQLFASSHHEKTNKMTHRKKHVSLQVLEQSIEYSDETEPLDIQSGDESIVLKAPTNNPESYSFSYVEISLPCLIL